MAIPRALQTHLKNKGFSFTNSMPTLNQLPWLPPATHQQVLSRIKQQTHYRPALQIFMTALQHKGFRHNQSTYALMIRILGKAHQPKLMELLLQRMKKEPFTCHVRLLVDVIKFYVRASKPEEAIYTFYNAPSFKCKYSLNFLNTLLRVLVRNHYLDMARDILYNPDLIHLGICPNACSYNIVIKAYCNANDVGSAFGLFRHMEAQGCLSDVITYGALIGGLCHNGRVQESIGLLHQMHEKSCNPDVVVYNTIINGLCREGDLCRVNEMLSDMEVRECKPDIVTYNSFMYGLCKMGKFQDAVDLLKDVMPQKGIHPDIVSFSTVMCFAKPHEFRVLQGNMLAKGFNPDVAGCSIIIKSLCKEGSIFEAVHVVHSFPSAVSYRVIIGSLCDEGMYEQAREILGEALKKGFGKNHEKKFRTFQSLYLITEFPICRDSVSECK